jgi:hypothetical protein
MPICKNIKRGLALGAVIFLASCGTTPEPFDFQANEIAIKPGRGVFTGEEGSWTIYRLEMPEDPQAPPAEATGDRAATEATDTSELKDQESACE